MSGAFSSHFRLHHVSILCAGLEESLGVYADQLGQEANKGKKAPGAPDQASVGRDGAVTVQLVGKPRAGDPRPLASPCGYNIYQVSYQVEDVERACAELKSKGVRVAWEPQNAPGARHGGLYDEDGLLFEVFSNGPAETGYRPEAENPGRGTALRLHHVSILTPNLRRAQRFYEEKLGLKTVFELTQRDGGLIFMIDRAYDHWKNNFMLEIVGPPDLEPREVELLNQRGACYDHVCYTAKDVKKAWQKVIQRGGKNAGAPARYHGTWMAWVKDSDGNDIEIMQPIPKFVIDMAIERGQVLNGFKLWQAAGSVMAYAAHQPVKFLQGLI